MSRKTRVTTPRPLSCCWKDRGEIASGTRNLVGIAGSRFAQDNHRGKRDREYAVYCSKNPMCSAESVCLLKTWLKRIEVVKKKTDHASAFCRCNYSTVHLHCGRPKHLPYTRKPVPCHRDTANKQPPKNDTRTRVHAQLMGYHLSWHLLSLFTDATHTLTVCVVYH